MISINREIAAAEDLDMWYVHPYNKRENNSDVVFIFQSWHVWASSFSGPHKKI